MEHDQLPDVLRAVVVKIFEAEDAMDATEEARRQELEAKGYRIVEGGQTGPYGEDGKAPWAINDFRTGQTLAEGRGGPDDMDAAWLDTWYSNDRLAVAYDADGAPEVHVEGLPDDLIDAIREEVTRPARAADYREWAGCAKTPRE